MLSSDRIIEGERKVNSKLITIEVKTTQRTQLIDITAEVEKVVSKSGVNEGLCRLFVPHTTAALTINEKADPTVPADILMELNKVIPFDDNYRHAEGNSAAHVKSSLLGVSHSLIISGGSLLLGVWQGVFFCEFDGPRRRKVVIKTINE